MWSPHCQTAFEKLKQLLTSAPLLAFPQFDRQFLLETDTSGLGLGAVLAQHSDDGAVRPVAYASRSLRTHEKNYGITELEGLGVVWAVKYFRHYLYMGITARCTLIEVLAEHPTTLGEASTVGDGNPRVGH